MRNLVFVFVLSVVSFLLAASGSQGAIGRSPGPIASASQVAGPQSMTVWITFADGSRWPGIISWWGSPEEIDWRSSTVTVNENGKMRFISNWWLLGATVTARQSTTLLGL